VGEMVPDLNRGTDIDSRYASIFGKQLL